MTYKILLQHGWAYDPNMWNEWISFLPETPLVANRGYFSPSEDNSSDFKDAQVIVTHSLGLHFLSADHFQNCKLLLILSGFQEFHPASNESRKFSLKVIEKMLREVELQNDSVLTKFYQRALRPVKEEALTQENIFWSPLGRDLCFLNENTLDLSPIKKIPKVLILHGDSDAIVPVEKSFSLAEQLPNSEVTLIPNAGHALPLSHPKECWAAIQKHWPLEPPKLKTRIAHSFSRCAASYHEHAHLQRESSEQLLSLLPESIPDGEVLEIGCGTGFVTEGLLKKFPNNPLIISDIAPGMVQFCREQLQDKLQSHKSAVDFLVEDGENLTTGPYSLVISGLSVQWFEDLPGAISKLFHALKSNGSLSFSFMENKSFPEWKKVAMECELPFTGHPLPETEDIAQVVKALDCEAIVSEKAYTLRYDSPKEFFSEFKKLGTNCTSSSTALSRNQWVDLFKKWQKDPEQEIESTYNICYVTLKRKSP